MDRRAMLIGVTALAGLSPLRLAAQANYPSKPIHIIVPFTPGGSSDILARALGQALNDAWRQPVIVENKPGAAGTIGAEAAMRAAPDGYTLFMGHVGTLAANPALYSDLRYKPLVDFSPVALVAMVPNVLVVHPSVPARTVGELVALAKARPGTLNYSSSGAGSAAHLAVEYFKLATGTDIVHVPYKGTAPALTDLIGGQVSLTMTGLPPLLPHIRAGKLRALGVASSTRLAQLPEVSTIAEAGVAGFEATQWYGILAPARTSQAIVEQLAAEIRRSMERPDLKKRLEAEGAQPSNLGPAEFQKLIREEIDRWAKVIRAARIQI
jgi:tripartite-type tricarboxylate transporter receptor subunit TctC